MCWLKWKYISTYSSDFNIAPIEGLEWIVLPGLTECKQLHNDKEETPTPEDALAKPHLSHLADSIPLNNFAKIIILLLKDILRVHMLHQPQNDCCLCPKY